MCVGGPWTALGTHRVEGVRTVHMKDIELLYVFLSQTPGSISDMARSQALLSHEHARMARRPEACSHPPSSV